MQNLLYLPLRQLVPRADLEPRLRRERADHDGRELRRAGPRRLLRGGRRDPRRGPEPHAPGRRDPGDGAARQQPTARRSATRRSRSCGRSARSSPTTSSAASSTAIARRRGSRPTRRSRPSPRSGSRSTRGAGPACRSSSGPASACPRRRPRSWCGSSRRRSRSFAGHTLDCSQNYIRIRFNPEEIIAIGAVVRKEGEDDGLAAGRADGQPPAGRRGAARTPGCCKRPWPATRACSRARTPSRPSGGSSSRCSRTAAALLLRAGDLGPAEADRLLPECHEWHNP